MKSSADICTTSEVGHNYRAAKRKKCNSRRDLLSAIPFFLAECKTVNVEAGEGGRTTLTARASDIMEARRHACNATNL